MKKVWILLWVVGCLISCSTDDTTPENEMEGENQEQENTEEALCNGAVCEATILPDETMATVPDSAFGVFETEYTFADTNSPFTLGTKATFQLTSDQKLIVAIEGFDCITISNPIWRYGADGTSGNYTFKDDCRDDLAYNVSYNTDGTFNEVNIEPAEGIGFFGQFTLR